MAPVASHRFHDEALHTSDEDVAPQSSRLAVLFSLIPWKRSEASDFAQGNRNPFDWRSLSEALIDMVQGGWSAIGTSPETARPRPEHPRRAGSGYKRHDRYHFQTPESAVIREEQ